MLTIFDDTFAGPGELDGHVSDYGVPWEARYTVDSPAPGPLGEVNFGLTHPLYPAFQGYPIEGVTSPPFVVGEGTWYITCIIDIFDIPTSLDDAFEFGLYETTDGQLCATRLSVYNATVQFLYQPFDAPTPPSPTSVWGQIALGSNTLVMKVETGGAGTTQLRLSFNGVDVMEFTSDKVWPNSKPYLLIRADTPVKVNRFTIATDAVAPPEFWTNIVKAVETP